MSADYIMKFCPFCGSKVIPNAKFCVECGKELKINFQENKEETTENIKESNRNSLKIEENKAINDNQKIVFEEKSQTTDNLHTLNDKTNTPKKQRAKKNFSVLNQSNQSHYQEEKNNIFDVKRPNSESNVKNQQKNTVNTKQEFPQTLGETSVADYNRDGLPCPQCMNKMHLTKTSGLFSKSVYHYCKKCNIKFRENNDFLILEEEPQYTRMSNKLHNSRYTWKEWNDILSGEFTPNFANEFNQWQFDSNPSLECPACNHVLARYKKPGLGTSYYLICTGCGLSLEEHKNNFYTLYDCVENLSPLWKYGKKLFTLQDMKRIIDSQQSEECKAFRQKKVRENELKIQEHKRKVKQEQDDLALFAQSLESGNPMLPVPSDTTIVLKKNEVPVYKMYNITLSEPRAVRTSSGGYGGTSVRIAKGVTIHSGRTASKSESHDEIKLIDQGELLITNQRVIFLGSNRTTNIDINKIISITSNSSMIQIQRSNKQKPEYFNNIRATESFQVEGRQYTVTIDGEMLKKLILGQIN